MTMQNYLMLTKQIALDAEATLLGDTIDNILDRTKFNGKEVVDKAASITVAINYTGEGTTTTVGPEKSITAVTLTDATNGVASGDTLLNRSSHSSW